MASAYLAHRRGGGVWLCGLALRCRNAPFSPTMPPSHLLWSQRFLPLKIHYFSLSHYFSTNYLLHINSQPLFLEITWCLCRKLKLVKEGKQDKYVLATCWAAPLRPASPVLTQTRDWRKSPKTGHQLFGRWEILHIWSKRVLEWHPTSYLGELKSGWPIGYQGNQQRGTALLSPLG